MSLRAAALRLVLEGLADWTLYKQIPGASEAKSKRGQPPGEPFTRPRRRLLEHGRRVGEVMTSSVRQDVLSRSEAMSYLNLRSDDLSDFMEQVSVA